MPLTDLLIGQASQLALQYVPVQVKERLKHRAFPAGAHQLIRRKAAVQGWMEPCLNATPESYSRGQSPYVHGPCREMETA